MSRSSIDIPVVSKFDPTGIKQAQSALSGFGKSLVGIGTLVAGAFAIRGIVNFGLESVIAAERAQQFNDILAQVAKTTGVLGSDVGAATSRMIKFADAQELVIGVEAELIKEAQAVLLSFKAVGASANDVGGTFDRATKAAFDMAAVLKTDARGSAVQLGKALENPIKGVTALAKAGTTFTDQQKAQIKTLVESNRLLEAQDLILTEVESQYGGAAEAAALGSEKIKLAFGQVQDALGAALAPAFEKFTTFFINEVVPPLTKFFEEDFPVMLAGFSGAWAGLTEALGPVGAALKEALEIPESASVLESLLDSIANLPESPLFQQFVDSMVRLVPSLLELIPPLTEMVVELIPLLISIIPGLIWFIDLLTGLFGNEGLAGAINEVTEGQWGWIKSVENFKIAAGVVESVVTALATPWVKLSEAINDAFDALKDFFSLSGGKLPSQTVTGGRRFGELANGGRATGGLPYLVGEMGPELFMPGRGGNVVPNDRLGSMGGGANITINVTAGMGTNGAQVGEQIVNAIKRYERVSGPVFASA
jgi:hypothetical protein